MRPQRWLLTPYQEAVQGPFLSEIFALPESPVRPLAGFITHLRKAPVAAFVSARTFTARNRALHRRRGAGARAEPRD